MARVIWSPRVLGELNSILEFVARDSPEHSKSLGRRIVASIEELGDFPEAGSIVPEFDDPAIRERFVFRYRIIYRIHNDAAQLVTIHHGSRELGSLK